MTWLEFQTAVKTLLTVDAQRLNLTDYVNAQIRYAVLNLQQFIPGYRVGHETVYGREDLTREGKASVGQLPTEAVLRNMSRVVTGATCQRQPMVLYEGGWENRFDLVCGRPKIFRCHGLLVLPPQGREFMVYPAVEEGTELDVFWDGVKLEYQDGDTVPYEELTVPAVAAYVKAQVLREVHKDPALYQASWQDFLRQRTALYLGSKERQEAKPIPPAPQTNTDCTVCGFGTGVVEDTEIEFVAFGDSGDDTATVLYPYPYPTPTNEDYPVLVANLARTLEPDLILHLGDMGYPTADASNYQDQVLEHWGSYIEAEKLFLAMGNHDSDWLFDKLEYLGDLNANAKYYRVVEGPCEFFVLDSNSGDVATQNTWLQAALVDSDATWKIVALHHAPYTSEETHQPGSTAWRLDYSNADLVLAGHGHLYERLTVDDVPYLVSGLGGRQARAFAQPPIDGSQYQYFYKHGLVHVTADSTQLIARFVNVEGVEIDRLILNK